MLLKHSASLGIQREDGLQPIHDAARRGHETVASLLLDGGSEVDARSAIQRTPLHHACWNGHVHIAKLLVGRGADTTLNDKNGDTALIFAVQSKNEEMVRFVLGETNALEARGSEKATALHRASVPGCCLGISKLLIESGAEVRLVDLHGNIPLHIASFSGREELVEFLLSNGSDPFVQDAGGDTPLDVALKYCKPSVATLLQQAMEKADPTFKIETKYKLPIDDVEPSGEDTAEI